MWGVWGEMISCAVEFRHKMSLMSGKNCAHECNRERERFRGKLPVTDKQGRNTFYNHENNVSEEQGRSSHVTETSEGWTILKHLRMSHALLRTVMAKKEEQLNDSNPYPAATHAICHGCMQARS